MGATQLYPADPETNSRCVINKDDKATGPAQEDDTIYSLTKEFAE